MDHRPSPPSARALPAGVAFAAACALVGCASYKPAPLELDRHRAAVADRLGATDPVSAFVERLAAHGVPVPERFDPSDGLSLAEGEVLALFYNPDLRVARLEAGVALANRDTAGLWEDPVFGFDGAEIWAPDSPFQFGLVLNLTIPISGRLEVAKERAGAAYEAELRRIVDAEWRMRGRVREAWGEWTAASERLVLLDEVIARAERIGSITDQLEAAGELTRVEARLLRVELAGRRVERSGAAYTAERTRLELLGLMGLAPDATVELLPALEAPGAPVIGDPIDRLIRSNTALAVRRAEYRTAEETLRLEVQNQYPDIVVGSGYGSEEADDRILMGVAIPVPILNANRAGIAEARALREVARASAETTFERLSRELWLAQAALDGARAQRAAFEGTVVPMLDEQFGDVERLAELGEVDTLVLLETVTRRFEAKSRLLDLRLAELNAAVALATLLGPDEPGAPAPVAPAPEDTEEKTP